MRNHRRVPQPESRSTSSPNAKPLSQAIDANREADAGDEFLEVQAESGRRMRPIVTEHSGEAE